MGTKKLSKYKSPSGEIGIGSIDRRSVEARLGDTGLEIVRDNLGWDAAEELEGALVRAALV